MESNRDHVFEYKSGRLNMQDIGLDGPRSEALCLNFLMNGDCDILVPRDFPVGVRIFCRRECLVPRRTRDRERPQLACEPHLIWQVHVLPMMCLEGCEWRRLHRVSAKSQTRQFCPEHPGARLFLLEAERPRRLQSHCFGFRCEAHQRRARSHLTSEQLLTTTRTPGSERIVSNPECNRLTDICLETVLVPQKRVMEG
jgi:hypothetical protein